ncbi:MAG: voltage-gated potassium channel [Hyphomicrobiaceae bacterium]|jgi:voltage-gated potassium channel
MRQKLRDLYFGKTRAAKLFRYSLVTFDIVSILFFVVTSLLPDASWIYVVDFCIAIVIVTDVAARIWIAEQPMRTAFDFMTIIDYIVILTLLLPSVLESFLFLRIMRALRLLRTYRVLQDLRGEHVYFRRNEDVILSVLNLGVFVFVMTAVVYVLQKDLNPQIANYIDALYFTVTALTTTGFGDVVMKGTAGKLLAVVIMVIGVALFLRMVQTIFRPNRVHVTCSGCGLNRHDADAVHCKHCGKVMMIETEGLD